MAQHLAGHWRVDDALDPRQIVEAVAGLSGQLGPVRSWSAPWSSCRCRWPRPGRRSASPAWTSETAHNVRDKSADEDRAQRGRRAVRPAPAGHRAGRGAGVRRRGGLPAGGQAAGRGRRAGDLPARRRRLAAQLARRAAAAGRRPRAAGGVPRRRGAHVRQRHASAGGPVWASISDYLPAAAGGAAQPVDPVDGAAAAGAGRPALRRHQARSGRPRCARSACRTRSATWSGSAARTDRSRCPKWAPARRARRSPRCSATSHDVDFYRAVDGAGDPRPVRPAGAQVRVRHRLPARAGPRPGARGPRRRGAAAPDRTPGRGGQAAASRASPRRRATRARAT